MPADRVPLNFLCRIRLETRGPTRVAPRVSFRAQSGPPAVVRHDHPLSATPSWRGFRPVWNSSGSAQPVWGTEGPEFKSRQPDKQCAVQMAFFESTAWSVVALEA